MSYTKTVWENLPSTNTPVNATNLNKIENQLETNTSDLSILKGKIVDSGFKSTVSQFTYNLEGLRIYLLTIATVGNGNVYDPYTYIIVTGASSSNAGAALELGNGSGYNKPTISLSGLTLSITTTTPYNILSLVEIG
jgi:hypothetical protein